METKPQDTLRAVVKKLANDLGTKVAFVCEVCGENRERARTLALYVDHQFLDSIEYDVAGTPCSGVYEKGLLVHSDGTASQYPSDHVLQEWKIESYMGVPYYDASGQLIGHVGVLDDVRRRDLAESAPALERAAALVREELVRRGKAS